MTSAQVDSIYQRSSRAVHQTRDTPSSLLRAAAAGTGGKGGAVSAPMSSSQAVSAPWNKRTSVMSHHTGAPGLPSSSGIASTSDALGTVSSGALRHAHQQGALAGVSLPAAPRQPTADEPRRSAARNTSNSSSPFRAQQHQQAPPAAGDPLEEAPRYVILYNRTSQSSVSTVNDVLARTQHPHPILFDWSVRAVDVGDAERGQTHDNEDQVVVQRLQRMREFAPALRDGVVLYDRVQRCAYQDVNTIAHHIVAQRDVLVGALVAHEMVRRRTGAAPGNGGNGNGGGQPSATARQLLYNVDGDAEYGAGAAAAAGGNANRTVAEVCQRQVLPCNVKDLDRYGAEAAARIRFGGGNAGGGGGDGGEYDQTPPRARGRHNNGSGDIGSIQVSRGGAGAGGGGGGGGGGGSASGARA